MSWQNYRQLKVWHKAMALTDEVYDLADLLPKKEEYALGNQLRRAVVSIPSNIAEGNGRLSAKEFRQFLAIAKGSVYETETQLLICIRRKYFSEIRAQTALILCDEIARMLTSLILHTKD